MAIAPTSVTKPVEQSVQPSTPSSGTYTFKERSSIKAEPSVASPELAYYDAGMSVNYDKVVNNDGYTWLSYLSYSGYRFYVAIAPTSVTKPVEQSVQPSTPSSGTYTFKERSSIKAEPSVASPELAYYDAGMSVNYDKVVNNDGYTWLSYLSYSGNRFYVAIAPTSVTKPVEQPVQPSTPSSGTYTFKERSSIKAEPSVASPELAYYDAGMSVNYDRLVTADGHTWLSYLSRGGSRRYISIDGKATAVAQPTSPSLAATGTYTFTQPSSIKTQPSVASPELAYYDKGMSVRYDKVLTADGHTWLSYVTYSGARRYVDIS